MKFLSNPVFLHGAVVLFCASFAFLLGLIFMRLLRKSIEEEADVSPEAPTSETLPLHVYNTVIRQLKQQQDELKEQSRADQQRSRTTERFNEAVLSNLSCGVLSIGKNGLIKSTNPAAKQILGFASPVGMSVQDIFRGAIVASDSKPTEAASEVVLISDEFGSIVESANVRHEIQAEYETPAGETRLLLLAIVPVPASDASTAGAACLITDVTELKRLRQQFGAHGGDQAQAAGAGS